MSTYRLTLTSINGGDIIFDSDKHLSNARQAPAAYVNLASITDLFRKTIISIVEQSDADGENNINQDKTTRIKSTLHQIIPPIHSIVFDDNVLCSEPVLTSPLSADDNNLLEDKPKPLKGPILQPKYVSLDFHHKLASDETDNNSPVSENKDTEEDNSDGLNIYNLDDIKLEFVLQQLLPNGSVNTDDLCTFNDDYNKKLHNSPVQRSVVPKSPSLLRKQSNDDEMLFLPKDQYYATNKIAPLHHPYHPANYHVDSKSNIISVAPPNLAQSSSLGPAPASSATVSTSTSTSVTSVSTDVTPFRARYACHYYITQPTSQYGEVFCCLTTSSNIPQSLEYDQFMVLLNQFWKNIESEVLNSNEKLTNVQINEKCINIWTTFVDDNELHFPSIELILHDFKPPKTQHNHHIHLNQNFFTQPVSTIGTAIWDKFTLTSPSDDEADSGNNDDGVENAPVKTDLKSFDDEPKGFFSSLFSPSSDLSQPKNKYLTKYSPHTTLVLTSTKDIADLPQLLTDKCHLYSSLVSPSSLSLDPNEHVSTDSKANIDNITDEKNKLVQSGEHFIHHQRQNAVVFDDSMLDDMKEEILQKERQSFDMLSEHKMDKYSNRTTIVSPPLLLSQKLPQKSNSLNDLTAETLDVVSKPTINEKNNKKDDQKDDINSVPNRKQLSTFKKLSKSFQPYTPYDNHRPLLLTKNNQPSYHTIDETDCSGVYNTTDGSNFTSIDVRSDDNAVQNQEDDNIGNIESLTAQEDWLVQEARLEVAPYGLTPPRLHGAVTSSLIMLIIIGLILAVLIYKWGS